MGKTRFIEGGAKGLGGNKRHRATGWRVWIKPWGEEQKKNLLQKTNERGGDSKKRKVGGEEKKKTLQQQKKKKIGEEKEEGGDNSNQEGKVQMKIESRSLEGTKKKKEIALG